MSEERATRPDGLPEFWSFLGRLLTVDAVGHAESWAAPVAKMTAPDGFGESIWIDAIPNSVVAIRLGGSTVTKSRGLGAGRKGARVGNFTLQPKGTPNHYSAAGSCTFAQISLNDSLLDRVSDIAGQPKLSGRLRPDLIFDQCPHLNGAAMTYVRRALDPVAPPTTLEMEGRAFILLDRLLELHGEVRTTSPARGGLAPWQLRRVTDFMHEHAQHDLILEDLARLVDLSAKHFARAFRQSTGLPPHRWLMNQRIEKAREMLAMGDIGIAEVALVCGFADQSHFTATFRKATGVTPGSYRRAARI